MDAEDSQETSKRLVEEKSTASRLSREVQALDAEKAQIVASIALHEQKLQALEAEREQSMNKIQQAERSLKVRHKHAWSQKVR